MASQPWTDDDDMIVLVGGFLLMDSSSDEEAEQVPRLPPQPQRTLSVDGQAYMNHLLEGNPHTIHALLRGKVEKVAGVTGKRDRGGIRCAKWTLRLTTSRLRRGKHKPTPARLAPASARHRRQSSPPSSQNSCTGLAKGTMDINGKWSADHTEIFIRILLEEKNTTLTRNNISQRSLIFKSQNWKIFQNKMHERIGCLYTEDMLRAKLRSMRSDFRLFQSLLNRSGFGYDEELGTVTADPLKLAEVFQIKAGYKKFQKRGLAHYMLLKELFDNSFATGHLGRSSEQGTPDTDEEDSMYESMTRSQGGANTSSGSKGKRKTQERDAERATKKELIHSFTEFVQVRTCHMKTGIGAEGSSAMPMPCPPPPPATGMYDVPSAMAVLNEVILQNGLSQEFWFEASALFRTNLRNRQAFLCSPPQFRLAWLRGMLGGGGH